MVWMNGSRIEKEMRETEEEVYTVSFNPLKHKEGGRVKEKVKRGNSYGALISYGGGGEYFRL
jgi:hypothetical protein